ncbi:MAG: hypothetical protein V5B31_19470 [Candidatus Accumulibacter propinquus]|uniref:hypothetical protein n=1 Tax=Candidatus Accumulibacter propinquus TaxID=2954380 RepID=UPI002FC2B054
MPESIVIGIDIAKQTFDAALHMSSQLQMMHSISNKFFGSPTRFIPSSGASSF